MAKKSKAQIRRAMKRAESRGEEYIPTEQSKEEKELSDHTNKNSDEKQQQSQDDSCQEAAPQDVSNKAMTAAAIKLLKELDAVTQNEELRSKERRSLKRKTEAIAAEEAGCTVEEMQKFFEENQTSLKEIAAAESAAKPKTNKPKDTEKDHKHQNPYIVFVGQLNYDTTKQGLLEHIRTELGSDFKVNEETVKVRLLTDAKTKKSRGMAFVEVMDPEVLYACLKLHHTILDGRRLNVERSAGGKKGSDARSQKLKRFREEQEQYLANVVDNILADYQKNGELQENELDEGVMALCKRHTASLVEAALKKYIESNGREMDNPSAYFTFLLCKLAEEGVYEDFGKDDGQKPKSKGPAKNNGSSRGGGSRGGGPSKKAKTSVASQSSLKGVDFSSSEATPTDGKNLSSIFPSLSRGRGRGYM